MAESSVSCKVLCGDCRELLPDVVKERGPFGFIFADPPFNIGQKYNGCIDSIHPAKYAEFTGEWIKACYDSLDDNGIMALHGPDNLVLPYLTYAEEFGLRRIAWINWHYRFGMCLGTGNRSNWTDARCHCLVFAKGNTWTWNPQEVLVDSDRVAYGDKRIHETESGGKRLPGTIWGCPSDGPFWGRIHGGNKERRKQHPNQLPEVYLERLIRAYTNPGDWVLDPFAGSGTTAVVAVALGRPCVTIDISEESCASVVDRIYLGAVRVKR